MSTLFLSSLPPLRTRFGIFFSDECVGQNLRNFQQGIGFQQENKLLFPQRNRKAVRRRMIGSGGMDRAGAADDGHARDHLDLSMHNLASALSDRFQVEGLEAELKSETNLKDSNERRVLPDTETANQDQENVDPTIDTEAKARRAKIFGGKAAVPKTRSLRRLVIGRNSAMAVSTLKNWEGSASSDGSDTETESDCGSAFGESFKSNVSTASLQRRGSLSLSPSFRSRNGSQESQGLNLSPIQGRDLPDSAETPPPRWPAKVRDYFGQVPDFESTGNAAGDLSTHRDNVFRSLHAFATSSLRAVSFSSSMIQARRSLQVFKGWLNGDLYLDLTVFECRAFLVSYWGKGCDDTLRRRLRLEAYCALGESVELEDICIANIRETQQHHTTVEFIIPKEVLKKRHMGDYESIAKRFESNFDMSLARGEGILVRSASAEKVHSCGRKVGVGKLQLVGDGGIFSCAFVMASLFIVASLLAANTVTAFAPAASKLPLRSAPPQHTTPAFPLRSSNRRGPAGAVRMAVGDPQLLPLLDPDTAIALGAYATCQGTRAVVKALERAGVGPGSGGSSRIAYLGDTVVPLDIHPGLNHFRTGRIRSLGKKLPEVTLKAANDVVRQPDLAKETLVRSVDRVGECVSKAAAFEEEAPVADRVVKDVLNEIVEKSVDIIDQHIHLVRDLHQVVDILSNTGSIAKDVISTAEHGIIDGAMLAEPILTSLKPGVGSAVMQIIASIST